MVRTRRFWNCCCPLLLIFIIALGDLVRGNETQSDAAFFAKLDEAWIATLLPQMQDAIKRGEFPGGVLCVGRKSGKPWIRNVGNRQVMPHVVEGTTDTIYDLASLTKPLVTSTLILKLHEEGKLGIDQPVAKYLRLCRARQGSHHAAAIATAHERLDRRQRVDRLRDEPRDGHRKSSRAQTDSPGGRVFCL